MPTRGGEPPCRSRSSPSLACSDNYAYLLRDAATGPGGARRRAGGGADRGGARRAGLGSRPDPDHPPPRRPHRRRGGAARATSERRWRGPRRTPGGCRRSTSRSPPATRWRSARASREVIDVPGHTIGHVAYYFPEAGALFSADSLMVMGCGRLFEGTAEQMWASLSKLAALPDATLVYSGPRICREQHALRALGRRRRTRRCASAAEEIGAMRQMGAATVPARLDLERATNPFLRATDAGLQGAQRTGRIAGCPSFRRDPAAQGRFLSRRSTAAPDELNITAIFLRFEPTRGILRP